MDSSDSDKPDADNPPPGFWFEEQVRGGKQILIVMKSAFPIGYIELDSYNEKLQWMRALEVVNLTLPPS